jgi:hypothetical protein
MNGFSLPQQPSPESYLDERGSAFLTRNEIDRRTLTRLDQLTPGLVVRRILNPIDRRQPTGLAAVANQIVAVARAGESVPHQIEDHRVVPDDCRVWCTGSEQRGVVVEHDSVLSRPLWPDGSNRFVTVRAAVRNGIMDAGPSLAKTDDEMVQAYGSGHYREDYWPGYGINYFTQRMIAMARDF